MSYEQDRISQEPADREEYEAWERQNVAAPPVIIGNLHNLATNRYHPIAFRHAPPPSGGSRYKSIGHHTAGFDTRDEALRFINGTMTTHYPGAVVNVERDYAWDGDDTPAMVIFFSGNGTPIL